MADPSKLPEAAAGRHRAWPSFSWFVPILWGMGFSAAIGILGIALVILKQKGFIPSWVFGWISGDREIQKRQFNLALAALLAIWVSSRLIKRGVFGEFARTTYTGISLKLGFVEIEPNDEFHAHVCAVKNTRIAALLAAFFLLESFLSWRLLGKPFLEHSLYDLLFQIVLMPFLFPVFLRMIMCVPERFILGIVTIRFVTGWVFEYSPDLVDPVASLIRQGNFLLSTLALVTSLGLLVSSVSKAKFSA